MPEKEKWTIADSVCFALDECGAYHDSDAEKWPTIEEITGAVSPTGDTKYLRDAVSKAVESLVRDGSLIWVIFGGRYALSSELTDNFRAKKAAFCD
jgi:hypothetical protein